MMLLARQLSWAFCGLLICATSAEVTCAQGGGGRGGFGGQQSRTRFELATLSEVQTDLKLNDEQKKLATDQLAKMREKRAEMFQAGGGGGGGAGGQTARTELAKMNADMDAVFVRKLDDVQKSRLNGLIAQVNGASALLDPAIAKALELGDELVGKLKSVNDSNQAARREAFQAGQDLSQEQRTEAMAKLTANESKSLMGLLSEAQVKKLESLKGAALTIDQTPLRPARRAQ